MSQQWFCYINGQIRGPLNARGVRQLADQGQLKPADQVRWGDDGQWSSAASINGLTFGSLAVAPSQTPPESAEHSLPPPTAPAATGASPRFAYKMVQMPPNVQIDEGISPKGKAAAYLEGVVSEYAAQG